MLLLTSVLLGTMSWCGSLDRPEKLPLLASLPISPDTKPARLPLHETNDRAKRSCEVLAVLRDIRAHGAGYA
jgi:hypothetical protein